MDIDDWETLQSGQFSGPPLAHPREDSGTQGAALNK